MVLKRLQFNYKIKVGGSKTSDFAEGYKYLSYLCL